MAAARVQELFVDDLCPSSSVAAGSKLTARFAGDGRAITVRSDRRVVVKGSLTSDSGDGIRGARVCALTRAISPGQPYVVADVAKTRGDGTYTLRLAPGPSRDVFVNRALEGPVLMRAGLGTKARVRPTFKIKSGDKSKVRRRRGGSASAGSCPRPSCDGRIVKVQAKVGKRALAGLPRRSGPTTSACTGPGSSSARPVDAPAISSGSGSRSSATTPTTRDRRRCEASSSARD